MPVKVYYYYFIILTAVSLQVLSPHFLSVTSIHHSSSVSLQKRVGLPWFSRNMAFQDTVRLGTSLCTGAGGGSPVREIWYVFIYKWLYNNG